MTIDELISALQKIKDDYGSCLPVLMLDSSGKLTAAKMVDGSESAAVIVSHESEDEEDDGIDYKPSDFTIKRGLVSSFLSAHSCSKKEFCYNTKLMQLIITPHNIVERREGDILSELPSMINDGWKVHLHAIDFATDNIIVTLCRGHEECQKS